MKVDKHSPLQWLILIWSGALLAVAMPLRILRGEPTSRPKRVVFYGHTLNGNLLALYKHWSVRDDIECYFLSFDLPKQTAKVKGGGYRVLNALNPADVLRLVSSDVIITSHGVHHFVLLRKFTSIKFVDVFHSPLAYKGFDSDDFGHLHGHDQVWVSSKQVRQIYIHKYGFDPKRVKVTGSARVEDITTYRDSAKEIKQKYGLDTSKKIILVAPTWKQDASSRSIVPFGLSLRGFMKAILSAGNGDDLQVVFRAHLNSSEMNDIRGLKNVHMRPYAKYPNAEEFIAISDVLVNDWSSIAIDYMTTNNPVVYLDVPAPFAKGFSAGPENRVGAVVQSGPELSETLKQALYDPTKYQAKYASKIKNTKELVFGDTLDGHTFDRCDQALNNLL